MGLLRGCLAELVAVRLVWASVVSGLTASVCTIVAGLRVAIVVTEEEVKVVWVLRPEQDRLFCEDKSRTCVTCACVEETLLW